MNLPDLRFHKPESLGEACELLARHGRASRLLAGGTDLLVDLGTGRLTGVEHLVLLGRSPGISEMRETAEGIEIGALVTSARIAAGACLRERFLARAWPATERPALRRASH